MTNLQMEYFIQVYELGNITAAAEAAQVSRPVISRVISDLEAEFGAALFDRVPRGVRPTAAGRAVYTLISSTLKNYRSTLTRLRDLEGAERDPLLRIGAHNTNALPVYDLLLKTYMQDHPQVHFMIVERPMEKSLEALENGEADVLFLPYNEMLSEKHLQMEPMFRNDLVLGVPDDSPLAGKEVLTLEDLLDLPLGIKETPLPNGKAVQAAYALYGRTPNIVVMTSSNDILEDMTRSGRCCALVTEALVRRWKGVTAVPVNFYGPICNYMVWNGAIPQSAALRAFLAYARDRSLA